MAHDNLAYELGFYARFGYQKLSTSPRLFSISGLIVSLSSKTNFMLHQARESTTYIECVGDR